MAQNRVIVKEGVGTRAEYSADGSTWALIPGAQSWTENPNPATTTQSGNFLQADQSTGQVGVPTIDIALDPYVQTHPAFRAIRRAAVGTASDPTPTKMWFRYTTKQGERLASDATARTAEIAVTTGAVTFAGTEGEDAQKARWLTNDYSLGLALVIGGTVYPVASIASDGAITVVNADGSSISGAVAASAYSIVEPSERETALCRVMSLSKGIPYDGHITGSISIAPNTQLGEPVAVYA